MTQTVTLPATQIDKSRIACLLCSAFEGGSNYWYLIEEFIKPPVVSSAFGDKDGTVYRHLDYPLSEGGALLVSDRKAADDADVRTERLDLARCVQGLEVMRAKYPRHYANWVSENDDAETGDVFLQCALFGELIYG